MLTRTIRSLALACACTAGLALPAAARAATLYVSNTAPVVAGGKSCTQPRYATIQAALDASGSSSIAVCPGTYTEQLTITKSVTLKAAGTSGSADVVLPASPQDTKTPCDEAPGTGEYQPDQDGVSICTSGVVAITGLKFEPKWAKGTCYDSLYGILVAGGATLKAKDVTVDGGGAFPTNGCQGGIGIQVGMAWTKPVEIGHATLQGVTVTDYQKNGITVDGVGSSATIAATTVAGAGATPETAQNGIQVSNGASAKIKSSKVSGNECDHSSCGADGLSQYQATGLLFFGASASSVASTELSGNDIGAYYYSTAAKQPSSPELTLSKDAFVGNRYEGVVLDQGDALIKGGTITGPGNVGIDLLQYEGQTLASQSSASGVKVQGQSVAGVKVESDRAAGDVPGRFVLTKSQLSGNAAALVNESESLEVVL